jgi:hypothetical protein
MKISAITTVSHNVGDDFVREGVLHLLSCIYPECLISLIHKHQPITARPEWEWLYHSGISGLIDRLPGSAQLGLLARLDRALPLKNNTDRILDCNLLVQCGAPVYWLHGSVSCAQSEWYNPLIRRRWSSVRSKVPFLNLAGGSCQTYNSDGSEFVGADETLAFIREFFDDCRLTTLRDELAGKILRTAGRSATILPCASIFARIGLGIETKEPSVVALNYMPKGGHYKLEATFDSVSWERRFTEFVRRLPEEHDYVFVCHNLSELSEAKRLFPGHRFFWSKDFKDYLYFFSTVKFGIFNRVHAAFALGSFGRPSFVIGNDSRARMCDMIKLRHGFVGDVTTVSLTCEFERLHETWSHYEPVMSKIQQETKTAYLQLIRESCRGYPGGLNG